VYRINRIVSASIYISADIMCITADSAAVNTGRLHRRSKNIRAQSPAEHAGWRGGRRETVTWYQPPRDTTVQYWVLAWTSIY